MNGSIDDALVPLADFFRLLNEIHEPPVSYNRGWNAAITGQLPVIRVGRGLYAKRGDLPRAAQHFGLHPRQPAPAE